MLQEEVNDDRGMRRADLRALRLGKTFDENLPLFGTGPSIQLQEVNLVYGLEVLHHVTDEGLTLGYAQVISYLDISLTTSCCSDIHLWSMLALRDLGHSAEGYLPRDSISAGAVIL